MRLQSLICAAVLAAAALAASAASAASLTVKPIAFKADNGTEVPAEWGEITVREDRADPKSRLIKLAFVRFKSTSPNPGAPIVYLAGGPGGSGIGAARGPRFGAFQKLRESADVIAFDQRGTGASTSVPNCDAAPLDMSRTFTREVITNHFATSLRRCWDVWKSQGIAIGAYNTLESAADLDELRRDLGARKLNLWGISYGTHLGLAYMKRYPSRVDRVVFTGVEALDQTVKLPANTEPLMARVAAVVAADPDAGMPDLIGLMRRVHTKLDANPATMPTGAGQTFTIDSYVLKIMAGQMIKNPDGIGQLLQIYRAIDAGAYAPVGPGIWRELSGQSRTVQGMANAMDLASGISPTRLALVETQARTALLGDALNFPMPHLANAIPGIDLGERFRAPFRSSRPVMVISGDLDGRTSIEEQSDGIRGLSKVTRIIVRNAGHDIFEQEPRLWPLMADFLAARAVPAQELSRPKVDVVPARR
jgi:pimeloyl-ACP methyl ester carboxylesterase